jgi:hypothetical protein
MKEFFLVIFFALSSVISASTYYVATTGKDSDPGSISLPWATWQKAFNTAVAGDIVYFRGGVYKPTSAYGNNITMIYPSGSVGHNGTASNPICFYNYPGETPILDCNQITSSGNFNTGIMLWEANYIKFRGLTVRNVLQKREYVEAQGINAYDCSNLTFENVTVTNIGGKGFCYIGALGYYPAITSDTTRYLNCDAFNCCDTYPRGVGQTPGNNADGFKLHNEPGAFFYVEGCRAWNCSDDGFDQSGPAIGFYKSCWAIRNGRLGGDGNGFKIGAVSVIVSKPTRILTNCLAAFNHPATAPTGCGFYEIDYPDYYRVNARIYNCTSYKNDIGFGSCTNNNLHYRNSVYRNNISYNNTFFNNGVRMNVLIMDYPYPESHNTWDFRDPSPGSMPPWFVETDTVKVSDADFVSVDSTGISGPRRADGSLPDINFLKLAGTSDMINAGVDVRFPFLGKAPDLGAFERE